MEIIQITKKTQLPSLTSPPLFINIHRPQIDATLVTERQFQPVHTMRWHNKDPGSTLDRSVDLRLSESVARRMAGLMLVGSTLRRYWTSHLEAGCSSLFKLRCDMILLNSKYAARNDVFLSVHLQKKKDSNINLNFFKAFIGDFATTDRHRGAVVECWILASQIHCSSRKILWC